MAKVRMKNCAAPEKDPLAEAGHIRPFIIPLRDLKSRTPLEVL
jgi:hypothetical protein